MAIPSLDNTGLVVQNPVYLVGASPTGAVLTAVGSDTNGNLKVIDYASSATGSAVPTNASFMGGKNPSGNLTGLITDASSNLYVNVASTTPPNNILATGILTGTGQSVNLTLQGTASINVDVSGSGFVGTIQVVENTPSQQRVLGLLNINSNSVVSSITANGNYRIIGSTASSVLSVIFSSYTSGSATINIYGSTAPFIVMPYSANAANVLTTSYLDDGFGNAIGSVFSAGLNNLAIALGATNYIASTMNSSTVQLSAGATFSGGIETAFNQQSFSVLLTSDQPGILTVNQYIDSSGTFLAASQTFSVAAGVGLARSGAINGNYINLSFKNTGTATTTTFNLNTAYGTIPSATQLNNQPISLSEINGSTVTPYNAQLQNADIVNTGISSGSITVGTTAVAARVSSTNLANRKMLMISPLSYTVYLGSSSSVTTANGIPIQPGQVMSFAFSANVTPYLISGNSGTVNIFEGA